MTHWKRKSLAVVFFSVVVLGFIQNGGIYVTAHNGVVFLAFALPTLVMGLYCRFGLGMSFELFCRYIPLPFGLLLSAFFISVGLRYEHPFVLGGLIAALAGGCLAALGINAKLDDIQVFARPSLWAVLLVLLIALSLPLTIVLVSLESAQLHQFWEPLNLAIALCAFGAIFCVLDRSTSIFERSQSASLNAVLLLTGFLVYEYFVGLERLEFAEWTAILTAQNVLTLVFAFTLYFTVVFVSLCHHHFSQLNVRHWHLVETFLFFVFMVIAPESINEIDTEQITQGQLDQMADDQ